MIRWLPVAPGLFPARLMTPVERKPFPSYNSKQILRTESHSIGSSHVSIPEPITGARGINYADCLHLSHMLSLTARAGGCLGRAQFRKTTWLSSPLLVLFSNTLRHREVAKCTLLFVLFCLGDFSRQRRGWVHATTACAAQSN